MSPRDAALLASTLSFVFSLLIAVWYVAPWLRSQGRAAALTVLLWFHAFRYVALELFSAQKAGLRIDDALRDGIAYGDLIGALLALAAIVALRYRFRWAVALVWLFVAATVYDPSSALIGGVRQQLMAEVHDVPWLILCFYVSALWVTLGLIVWQLVTRSGEPMESSRLVA